MKIKEDCFSKKLSKYYNSLDVRIMTATNQIQKTEQIQEIKRKWFEILVILITGLVSLSCGILFSWPSPFMVKIVEDKENYDITEEQASYFTVISTIGVIIIPPFLTSLIDRFGRKKLLLFTSIPYIITYFIKAFARNVWLFYFARLLNGISDSITFTCVIVFIGEISTPEVRGVWGNAVVCYGFLGQFVINILGIYCSIMVTSFICVTIPIIFFICFLFVPESPYFYIAKGKYEDAKISLRRLRRKNDVEEDFERLKTVVKKQLSESATWMDLLTNRINRRALFTSMFLRACQIFSGIFTFAPYIQLIFRMAGTNISPEFSTIVYTLLNFVLYSSAAYGSNKLGRRLSLISSLISTSVVFLLEATFFFIDSYYPSVDLTSMQWFPLAGLLVFLILSSYGIGTIPFLMPGELFATNVKAKGMAIVISTFGLTNFIVNGLFYQLVQLVGLGGPFLLFGVCNIISSLICYKYLPETKNKTLEEIQIVLSNM